MKVTLKLLSFLVVGLLFSTSLAAQTPESPITESSFPVGDAPVDDIVEKRLIDEKRVLPWNDVREADIFWEKRIWRVIDTREKMNLPFVYPERYFFEILMEAAMSGEITVYSTEDDKFTTPFDPDEVAAKTASIDTVYTFDPETYEETLEVVRNELDPSDIKRFRLKEVWFFDEETSTMNVRILGIAPMRDVMDENDEFLYEEPMFWVYYPDARKILARERVFNPVNDASPMTWEDIMEMRFFSSYIFKESNVYDRRLKEYLSGVDRLIEGERIKQEIFNFEQDLWSY